MIAGRQGFFFSKLEGFIYASAKVSGRALAYKGTSLEQKDAPGAGGIVAIIRPVFEEPEYWSSDTSLLQK